MAITPLPSLDRTSATFRDNVDTYFGTQIPLFSIEAELARAEVNANTVAAAASAAAALASELSVIAGGASVVIWVSGTTYAIGDLRWSPVNGLSYRRKTVGAGTTDPSLDTTNWFQLVTLPPQATNAGKFVTTDGTNASWTTLPNYTATLNQANYGGF